MRRGEFRHGDAMNSVEPPRIATGDVTEENVFAIPRGPTAALNLRKHWCDFEETRGVTPVRKQHPREHDRNFRIPLHVAGVGTIGLGRSPKDAVDHCGIGLPRGVERGQRCSRQLQVVILNEHALVLREARGGEAGV